MANDKLAGVDLRSVFKFIPAQADGSNIAITGAWDMPARIGKTYHDWGNVANNIEPYVSPDELFYGGRDIDYLVMLQVADELAALSVCNDFYQLVNGFTALVPFETDLGTWNVFVRSEIAVEYFNDGFCKLRIPFREPIVDLTGTLPKPNPVFQQLLNADGAPIHTGAFAPIEIGVINYDGFGIDGVMFRDMNCFVMELAGNFNRPAPMSGEATSYRFEKYRVTRSGLKQMNLKLFIEAPDYAAFNQTIRSFNALFSKPGLRYITKENDFLRDFFVKDGFTVNNIRLHNGEVTGILTVQLTEVNAYTNWSILTDANNNEIVTELGNIIIT
ncbi:hypothetical protein [Pedobacter zeae]|uniref:Uncharacterized protein n=1 Tax=Pedobacter zeae TaxID=1737356 RepID=A0A7W6K7L7_9SPHI|nr:hypothetical protein [Pedobacter zeae]MBB4106615.1 hypothetical protein [Pedobacter zeae]GGH02730.1 hypothetical protein GCM10007422_17350 [Pedobacter zeae]